MGEIVKYLDRFNVDSDLYFWKARCRDPTCLQLGIEGFVKPYDDKWTCYRCKETWDLTWGGMMGIQPVPRFKYDMRSLIKAVEELGDSQFEEDIQ